MRSNVTFSIGSIVLIDKVNEKYAFFDNLFDGIATKAANVKQSAKLFVYNRLCQCVSVNRLPSVYPIEVFEQIGFKKIPKQRTFYRDLERIGAHYPFILNKYQGVIKTNNLTTEEQFIDFSSTYFEGNKCTLAKHGYSRDHEPGKKQLTFGISTGINGIPTALTIQKGNVQDKKHFKATLKVVKKVLDKDSLLIFDCGANTKTNKKKVRASDFHYLTLKQKQKGPYKKYIQAFKKSKKRHVFFVENVMYKCVKVVEKAEVKYVFFSKKTQKDMIKARTTKFKSTLEKNEAKLRKVKKGKVLETFPSKEGYIFTKGSLQKTLEGIKNPYITDLEGYFILESSIDEDPEKILRLYKK